jgi:hypothetical protein
MRKLLKLKHEPEYQLNFYVIYLTKMNYLIKKIVRVICIISFIALVDTDIIYGQESVILKVARHTLQKKTLTHRIISY